jgi:carbon monoxide dehydrogenase subunit G
MAISTTIEVNRPTAEVFTYVTDPTRFIEWQNGVVSGHMETESAALVGDRCVTVRRIGFAKRPVTSTVTHVDPPRDWGIAGIDGPIRAEVNVSVEALEGDRRSKLTIEIDFSGRGIGRLLVPLVVRPQARREMPTNLRRLKHRLEIGQDIAQSHP